MHALLIILLDNSFGQVSVFLPSLACVKLRNLQRGCNVDLGLLQSLADYANYGKPLICFFGKGQQQLLEPIETEPEIINIICQSCHLIRKPPKAYNS